MTEHFPVVLILLLAVVAQTAATVMAMRLTAVAGRRLAWLLIAAALLLMTVRRAVPLIRLVLGNHATLDPLNEIVGLVLSVLMAAGVARMGPIFVERQQAKGALKERERQMSLLIDESPIAMVVSSEPDRQLLQVNRSFTELLGYTAVDIPDQAQWWPLGPLASPDESVRQRTAEEWVSRVNLARTNRRSVEPLETTVRCKDGSLRHVELRLSLIGDRHLTTVLDLTEHKRAAEERAARLRYADCVDQMSTAILGSDELEVMLGNVLDSALSTFECERAFFAFPCDPETASWRVAMDRARPEPPAPSAAAAEVPMDPDVAQTFRALLESSGPLKLGPEEEYPVPAGVARRFGAQSMISIAIRPKVGKPWQLGLQQCSRARKWTPDEERLLREVGQRLAGALSTLLVFRQLRESETLYRSLVSSMAEGVVLQTADGVITAANPAAERIEGRSAEEMLGRTSDVPQWDAVTEDGGPFEGQRQPAIVALRTGEPQTDVMMGIHRPDGTLVWISVNSQPLMAPDNPKPYAVVSTFHDVTARKVAEEALHRREEEFRALVENSPDFISRHDRDGRLIYCNPSVSNLPWVSSRELLGKTALELFPGDESGRAFHDAVTEVVQTGRPAELEFVLAGIDTGRPVVHHARFVPELDRAGKVSSVLAVGRDITDRKETEKRLHDSEERLRLTLEAAEIGNWDWDVKNDRWVASPKYYTMLGYEPKEVEVGEISRREWLDRVHSDDRAYVRARIDEALTRDFAAYQYEARMRHADGSYRWQLVRGFGIRRDPDGKVTRMLGIRMDTTERKNAERVLMQYAAIVESSDDAIIGMTLDGTITSWNRGAEHIFGYSAREIIGQRVALLLPEERFGEDAAIMSELRQGHSVHHFETVRRCKDGRLIEASVTVSPLRSPEGAVVGASKIARDITQRKRADAELLRHREHLEELVSERTAALEAANRELESFSYSVSHDLRTPLRAIDGFSRMLAARQALATDEEAQRLVRIVRESTAKMSQLIDGMLAFFRSGRVEMRSVQVDMAQLVNDVWRELEPARADHPRHLVLKAIAPARGDPMMLRQLWLNLLANAIKFTGPVAEGRVEIGGSRTGDACVYYVKDNGVGFNPEFGHKLFGVFQRLHRVDEFEGTGIGLAIVKRIVSRHGGNVFAEGELGKGATVRFSLPLKEPKE